MGEEGKERQIKECLFWAKTVICCAWRLEYERMEKFTGG